MPTDWSRRTLLRSGLSATAVALAGCTGTRSSPGTTTETVETTTPPPRRTLDGEPFDELRVEPTPAESPFRHRVRFLAQPTADHPARVHISVRNASDAAQTIQTSHWELPFPSPLAEARPDTGLVVSQDGPSMTDGCWRAYAKSYPMLDTRTLAPGEALGKEYAVANWTKNETCWPTGEYAFSQGYTVNPETDAYSYGWGFTLTI